MVITNITSLIAFITGGSLVASVIVNSLKKLWEDVSSRYGSLVTQIALAAVCILISAIAWAFQFLPVNIIAASASVFAGSIVLYEVVYKAVINQAIRGNLN